MREDFRAGLGAGGVDMAGPLVNTSVLLMRMLRGSDEQERRKNGRKEATADPP